MKRFLTFIVLFLIAGSITALGYSLYQIGVIGEKTAQTTDVSATSTAEIAKNDKEKDLSWMKEIKGISEDDATEKTTSTKPEPSTTSTEDIIESSTSTLSVASSSDAGTDTDTNTDTDPSIQDLGKADALTSTIYDYAFKQLVLSAELRHGTVFLTWTPATSETFLNYKVIRSTTDENPHLPNTPSVKTLSDVTQTAYTDSKIQSNSTYYYRICMTKQGKPPACGNILKVRL